MVFSISKHPTISEIQDLYKNGSALPSQVVNFFLNRSREVDEEINGVDNYPTEITESQAKECDRLLAEYQNNYNTDWTFKLFLDYPLFGIPFFLKSIIMAEGAVFNASSKILDGFRAPYSATVYESLIVAGAILLGISHMDEFATGSSGETSAYATTKNPFDITRVPGGSSSGPAVTVASGQAVFSLGTDTGGSIRQPSAFSNLVGLKPTYGLVSRYGVMPMASSLDQVGPMTNSVFDNLLVTEIISGQDPLDQTSLDSSDLKSRLKSLIHKKTEKRRQISLKKTTKPLIIGLPKEFYIEGTDKLISQKIENIIEDLKSLGHQTKIVSLPLLEKALAVYYMLMPVELSANLERYDGIRYAQQNFFEESELYYTQRDLFGEEVKRRIILGTYASSAGYYDAYYNQAQKVRYLIIQSFKEVFQNCDLLLTPTTPEFPFKVGEKKSDPVTMYLSDIFTCGINPARIPGLNIPLGLFPVKTEENEVLLPSGCQILGPEFSEDKIFELAQEIEYLVTQAKK